MFLGEVFLADLILVCESDNDQTKWQLGYSIENVFHMLLKIQVCIIIDEASSLVCS